MSMYFSSVYNDVRTDVINFLFYAEKCSILQFLDTFYICFSQIAPIEMVYASVVTLGYFQNFFKNALVMLCVCILVTLPMTSSLISSICLFYSEIAHLYKSFE